MGRLEYFTNQLVKIDTAPRLLAGLDAAGPVIEERGPSNGQRFEHKGTNRATAGLQILGFAGRPKWERFSSGAKAAIILGRLRHGQIVPFQNREFFGVCEACKSQP